MPTTSASAPAPLPPLPPLPPQARRALAALGLCTLLPALGTSIANVGLPALGQAFGAGYGALQWVVLAYLGASTGMAVLLGRLGDRHGRRRVLLAGTALFTLASLACALAPSLPLLVAARAAQGCGAAAMAALAMSLAGDTLPAARTGMALGLLGTMSGAGTALGPGLGGLLLAWGGWPALFLATAAPGLLALVLGWRWLPLAQAQAQGARTARAALPGMPWAGLAAGLLVASLAMTTLVVGPFHLSGTLALGSAAVGLAMSCGPLAAMLAGLPAGRAVDRHGVRPVLRAGLGAMAAGCVLLALLPPGAGVAGYVLALCCCTVGYALFQAANNSALLRGCAPARRGALSGLVNLARNLGLMAGAAVMGNLYSLAAASAGPAAAMGASFGLAVLLVGAAAALVLLPGSAAAAPAGRIG